MPEITVLDVESELMGRNVLSLEHNFPVIDYKTAESSLISTYNSGYIQIMLNADDLQNINGYEDLGFRFVEFRLFRYLRTANLFVSSKSYYPYKIELINGEERIEDALIILNQCKRDDRFSIDPTIPDGFAKKRLELYIRKSFMSFPEEFALGLINNNTGELVAFKTGKYISKSHVLYFYSYIAENKEFQKFSVMLENGVLEFLINQKVSYIEAVTSCLNIAELNESLKESGYSVNKTMVLLRKIFT